MLSIVIRAFYPPQGFDEKKIQIIEENHFNNNQTINQH